MPEAPDAWSDLVQLVELSRPSPVGLFSAPPPASRRTSHLVLRLLLLVVLPTLIGGGYLFGLAADRYVSEARFVVRKPSAPGRPSGPSLSIEGGPKALGGDDSYAVRDYLESRDALRLLVERADLRRAIAHAGEDPLFQFPGLLTGRSDESLFRLYQRLTSVDYDSTSGVVTLRTEAFRPEDAQRIATVLIEGGEALLNRLNTRAHIDALRVAEAQVVRSRAVATDAQDRLTAFRTHENMVDPTQLSKTVLETVAALSLQLVETSAQIDITRQAAPKSPQIVPLRARARALQTEIDRARGTLAGSDSSFAPRIAEYERLVLMRDFDQKALLSALSVQEAARLDVQRQQVYLEQIVSPALPDKPLYPHRVLWTGAIFLAGLVVFWLFRPERAASRA